MFSVSCEMVSKVVIAFELASKRLLLHDQVGELGGNIHVGRFQRRVLNRAQPGRSSNSDARGSGSQRRPVIVAGHQDEPLRIRDVGQSQLADGCRHAIGKCGGDDTA